MRSAAIASTGTNIITHQGIHYTTKFTNLHVIKIIFSASIKNKHQCKKIIKLKLCQMPDKDMSSQDKAIHNFWLRRNVFKFTVFANFIFNDKIISAAHKSTLSITHNKWTKNAVLLLLLLLLANLSAFCWPAAVLEQRIIMEVTILEILSTTRKQARRRLSWLIADWRPCSQAHGGA